jgi:hypothetical protein
MIENIFHWKYDIRRGLNTTINLIIVHKNRVGCWTGSIPGKHEVRRCVGVNGKVCIGRAWGSIVFGNEHGGEAPSGTAVDKEAEEKGLKEGGGAGIEASDWEADEGEEVVMEMEI